MYHDRKPGVKSIDVKIGDHVRVKNPRHVGKGQLKFSQPMEVVKVNGTCVTLKGGRKWNVGPNTTVPNSPVHEATRKSSRVKRVPRRLLE